MAQWRKKFEKWKDQKSPVATDEVTPLLKRVFGERLQHSDGTSHEYKISVPELINNPKYQFGIITVVVKGGQAVKAPYLHKIYEAACLLGLYSSEIEEEDEQENE